MNAKHKLNVPGWDRPMSIKLYSIHQNAFK